MIDTKDGRGRPRSFMLRRASDLVIDAYRRRTVGAASEGSLGASADTLRRPFAFRGQRPVVWGLIAAIVLVEGLVSGWNIGRAPYMPFYIDAARSMSSNWRALAFGAFDPGATITLDKLSGFLIPQVISTWMFGFHRWSVMLPQVIEGMVTVLATYVVGARWKGASVGLLAAAAMATMPLLSSMFGRSSEDCLVTMALALAFWCWQSAILSGRLAPLLFSCVWVAVGFQAKMLQAWFIIPALAVGYLVAAPNPVTIRLRRSALAAALTIILSLAWMTAIQLVPAPDRPFIDGTTNNNTYAMVFGFNGLNRVVHNLIPGVIGQASSLPCQTSGIGTVRAVDLGHAVAPSLLDVPSTNSSPICSASGLIAPTEKTSTVKLLLPIYATQVGWLYPLAAAGAIVGLWPGLAWWRRRRFRRSDRHGPRSGSAAARPDSEFGDPDLTQALAGLPKSQPSIPTQGGSRASVSTTLTLMLWLIIDGIFLSVVPIPHTSYLAAVTLQIAVLAAAGLVQGARAWTRRSTRSDKLVPAALLAIQTGWTCVVLAYSGVAPVLVLPTVALLGFGAVAAFLIYPQMSGRSSRLVLAGAAVAVFFAPSVWTSFNITTINAAYDDAHGGPAQSGPYRLSAALGPGGQPFEVASPFNGAGDPQLSTSSQALVRYLQSHTPPGADLMAVDSWRQAEPYIADSGLNVMSFGGYSGQAPTPQLQHLQDLINRTELHFILLQDLSSPGTSTRTYPTSGGIRLPGMVDGLTTLKIRNWVTQHCTLVPPANYEAVGQRLPDQTLYQCDPSFNSRGTPVPAPEIHP